MKLKQIGNHLLFLIVCFATISLSCNDQKKKRLTLENEINYKIAEDIRRSINKTIDGAGMLSTGFPIPISSIVNSIITKEKQDSIIISPIKKYLKDKLDKKKISELELFNNNQKERYQFVYETLLENRKNIINDISKKIPFAEIITESIIKHHH